MRICFRDASGELYCMCRRADVRDKRLRHELACFLNLRRRILRRFRASGEMGPASLVLDQMDGARLLAEQIDANVRQVN